MKNTTLFISILSLLLGTISCDKVTFPTKIMTELDTTLYTDGQFAEYPWPVFTTNSNTNRNVLIEDYTGHHCPNCPDAAEVAANIEAANSERVFVASIHTGPGGDGFFQDISLDCSDPENDYCYDFRTTESNLYGVEFGTGFGFLGNPSGNINRITFGTDMFSNHATWTANTATTLTDNDLKVNLQAESNYYAASNGVYLHVQSEFLEDLTGDYSIVTYVIQNQIIEDQDSSGIHVHHYHHHNVFIGCIDGEAWGHSIGGTDPVSGTTNQTDYSYVIPTGIAPSDIHFLTYIYDTDTYEILQVIKHTI